MKARKTIISGFVLTLGVAAIVGRWDIGLSHAILHFSDYKLTDYDCLLLDDEEIDHVKEYIGKDRFSLFDGEAKEYERLADKAKRRAEAYDYLWILERESPFIYYMKVRDMISPFARKAIEERWHEQKFLADKKLLSDLSSLGERDQLIVSALLYDLKPSGAETIQREVFNQIVNGFRKAIRLIVFDITSLTRRTRMNDVDFEKWLESVSLIERVAAYKARMPKREIDGIIEVFGFFASPLIAAIPYEEYKFRCPFSLEELLFIENYDPFADFREEIRQMENERDQSIKRMLEGTKTESFKRLPKFPRQ